MARWKEGLQDWSSQSQRLMILLTTWLSRLDAYVAGVSVGSRRWGDSVVGMMNELAAGIPVIYMESRSVRVSITKEFSDNNIDVELQDASDDGEDLPLIDVDLAVWLPRLYSIHKKVLIEKEGVAAKTWVVVTWTWTWTLRVEGSCLAGN